ncbi:hypothetical protein H0H87_000652 [Tephrocybe sp. NHM501043]|nr:hypothetical protein H0H87_000652 [Tephrocybe sp. NHM501043]
MGLSRCMDVLRLIEVLWPSAARALELLRGAKEDVQDPAIAPPNILTERRKRSAEQSLNDNDTLHRIISSDPHHDYLELRAPYTSQYDSHAAYTPSGEVRSHDSQSSAQSTYIPSSYDRWPSENTNSHSFGFPGTLSTSVLPQVYSTGLVDDRNTHANGHRSHGHHPASEQPRSNHTTTRYPQYWNDFSTFSQLGTAYGGYHESSPNLPQQPSASSHVYLSEPYSIYSEHLLSLKQLQDPDNLRVIDQPSR